MPGIITYAEILSRAAKTLEQEIKEWTLKADAMPNAGIAAYVLPEMQAKLAAVHTMLQIETGHEGGHKE